MGIFEAILLVLLDIGVIALIFTLVQYFQLKIEKLKRENEENNNFNNQNDRKNEKSTPESCKVKKQNKIRNNQFND